MYFHATRASRFIEMGRKKQLGTERSRSGNGANLGFEEKLWAAADKMRGHMDAGEYKHVALGLIFLKYISDAFQERYDEIKKEPHADLMKSWSCPANVTLPYSPSFVALGACPGIPIQ